MAVLNLSEEPVEIRRQIARQSTSVRELEALAQDEDIFVRSCVANNPNTPKEIKDNLKLEGKIAQYVVEFTNSDYCDFLYGRDEEWKSYVCDNFDEHVVLFGNRDYAELEEASWWKEAQDIIEALDDSVDEDDFIEEYGGYFSRYVAKEKLYKIYQEYDNWNGHSDDTYFIIKVAEVIHPELNLQQATLHGSMQSDWQRTVYDANFVDVHTLEDFYMGDVMEMRLYQLEVEDFTDCEIDEDFDLHEFLAEIIEDKWVDDSPIISSTEYWNLRREGFNKSLARFFGIPEGSFVVIDRY